MATGDILGNIERLRADLKHIKYPLEVDLGGCGTHPCWQACGHTKRAVMGSWKRLFLRLSGCFP